MCQVRVNLHSILEFLCALIYIQLNLKENVSLAVQIPHDRRMVRYLSAPLQLSFRYISPLNHVINNDRTFTPLFRSWTRQNFARELVRVLGTVIDSINDLSAASDSVR